MTPETSTSPFDAAIAELETRIRNMQITLETLRQIRADSSASQASGPIPSRSGETEVQHDTFFGLTIADAAKKYLTMIKATKSTADIAAALEHGGLKHSSKNFPTTVRSVLGQREEFLRVPNGDWGLTEWYPGVGRGRKSAKSEKPKLNAKTKKANTSHGTRKQRIMQVVETDQKRDWTAGEVATELQDDRKMVQATMIMLVQDGKLTKETVGYRFVKPQ